jgi:hypothetical protein
VRRALLSAEVQPAVPLRQLGVRGERTDIGLLPALTGLLHPRPDADAKTRDARVRRRFGEADCPAEGAPAVIHERRGSDVLLRAISAAGSVIGGPCDHRRGRRGGQNE